MRLAQIRRIEASTPEEVNRILDSFFDLKASASRNLDCPTFSPATHKGVFPALFTVGLVSNAKAISLQALEVGRKTARHHRLEYFR
jgi:CelD/BcsL family acetyltransferase involved in cellulose biosynthesis